MQKTRELNRNHHPTLKAIFKGAATRVIAGPRKEDPLYEHHQQLLEGGTKPNLAKLSNARQIAAIDLAIPSLRPGGVFITDNVLWSGRILDREPSASTRGILEFNRRLFGTPGIHGSIVPLRHGLGAGGQSRQLAFIVGLALLDIRSRARCGLGGQWYPRSTSPSDHRRFYRVKPIARRAWSRLTRWEPW